VEAGQGNSHGQPDALTRLTLGGSEGAGSHGEESRREGSDAFAAAAEAGGPVWAKQSTTDVGALQLYRSEHEQWRETAGRMHTHTCTLDVLANHLSIYLPSLSLSIYLVSR
jgi:hypothetical protein